MFYTGLRPIYLVRKQSETIIVSSAVSMQRSLLCRDFCHVAVAVIIIHLCSHAGNCCYIGDVADSRRSKDVNRLRRAKQKRSNGNAIAEKFYHVKGNVRAIDI